MASIQVREVRATFERGRYFGFSADGSFTVPEGQLTWKPPAEGGSLRYRAKIDHLRSFALVKLFELFYGVRKFTALVRRLISRRHMEHLTIKQPRRQPRDRCDCLL